MRVVFMGTPAFAVPVLRALLERRHDIAAVYTRAPKPAGRRGLALTPSPVQAEAERAGLPVLTPKALRDEAAATFAGHRADVAIVVAYGLILPKAILDAPRFGCLNLHASLLPRWRGAAPIQRAVMAGDARSGVMLMRMEEGLDTGPVALTDALAIGPDMTAGELHDALAPQAARLAAQGLDLLERQALVFAPQAEAGVLYAHKIDKAETRIDWSLDAVSVHNRIRGLAPFPGAYFEVDFGRGPERIKVLRAARAAGDGVPGTVLDDGLAVACGTDAVRLLELQRAGKAPMPAATFLRGVTIAPGTCLIAADAAL